MKLTKVKLRNFRCYRNETEIHLGDLSCFIGRNDVGKSSAIEALDGFFNDAIDKGDLATGDNDSTIEITCFFQEFPQNIILDSSVESSLVKNFFLIRQECWKSKKFSGYRIRQPKKFILEQIIHPMNGLEKY